jgi:hypothetical protein
VPDVPVFALESDCGNPLSKPLFPAAVPELVLFVLDAPVEPLSVDGLLEDELVLEYGLVLEVVDAFFFEDLLVPVVPEPVCATARALISSAVPTTETIVFITRSPSPEIQSGAN